MRHLNHLLPVLMALAVAACGVGFNTTPGGATAVKSRQPSASLEVPPDLMETTSEEITAAKAEQEELSRQEVLPESYPTVGSELLDDGTGTMRGHLTISHRRSLAADDALLSAEVSVDGVDWTAAGVELLRVTDNGDGTESLTYRSVTPIGDIPRQLIRVRAQSR